MRSYFFALLLTFTLQFSSAQKFSIGPRIGANLSHLNGLNYAMPRGGWDLGAFIIYKPCPHTGFSADLLLSSSGSRSKHSQQSGSKKETWDSYINMNYLKLPLLYNVYLGKETGVFKPKFFAGFTTGLLLSSRQSLIYSMEDNSTHIDSSSDANTYKQFKKIDIGGIVGGGFVYKMAENTALNLDVRYQYGFRDITRVKSSNLGSLYPRNISLLLGIAYLLK